MSQLAAIDVVRNIFNNPFICRFATITAFADIDKYLLVIQFSAVKIHFPWFYIHEISNSINCLNNRLPLDICIAILCPDIQIQ